MGTLINTSAQPINNTAYPVYNSPSKDNTDTDAKYNVKCGANVLNCAPEISSTMTFLIISGNYTVSGPANAPIIQISSNCTISTQFNPIALVSVKNTSLGRITIPSGTIISNVLNTPPTSIYSLQTLNDPSAPKFPINIGVTIQDAVINNVSNGINANLIISFARNYNHLTPTSATLTIAGNTANAPGQFLAYSGTRPTTTPTTPWPTTSTTPQLLTGTISGTAISGTAGKFNSAVTFTSQPIFTHIVHPSL
jgi:hypothetical protein